MEDTSDNEEIVLEDMAELQGVQAQCAQLKAQMEAMKVLQREATIRAQVQKAKSPQIKVKLATISSFKRFGNTNRSTAQITKMVSFVNSFPFIFCNISFGNKSCYGTYLVTHERDTEF